MFIIFFSGVHKAYGRTEKIYVVLDKGNDSYEVVTEKDNILQRIYFKLDGKYQGTAIKAIPVRIAAQEWKTFSYTILKEDPVQILERLEEKLLEEAKI